MWKLIRSRLFSDLKDLRPPAQQPFGADFGFTLFPEFILPKESSAIARVTINSQMAGQSWPSDGRTQLQPLPLDCFSSVVERLEEEKIVFPNYLNNQTCNRFTAGEFIRAHVDNLFYYDETFAILSIGAPCTLRFVHLQNGESMECIIPDRSVYILEGPARYIFMHMVLPVEYERFSVVLRRGILRTSGHFGLAENLPPQTRTMAPFEGNEILDALMTKQIGVPRISCDEEWMVQNNLGAFDTGEMVQRLRPLRDWSLSSQLDEDEERYKELIKRGYIRDTLGWRFEELKTKFREVEAELTVNRVQNP